MNIKKVIVSWPSTNYYPYLRILFYDLDGNLFESGSTISSTNNKAETDNFIVTASHGAYNNESRYYPINAISTEVYKDINDAPHFYFNGYKYNSDFTIEFKTIQPISKIKVCTKSESDATPNATLRVIDIYDDEESYNIDDTSNNVGTIHEYNLPVMAYNTNKIGIAETTISTNIQKIEIVKGINVNYGMPDDTEIRMALSNDDRNTYKIFDGSNWIAINKNDIASSGMLPSFVNSLTENDLQSFLNGKSLDACCTFKTNNIYIAPFIKNITLTEEKRYNKNKLPVTSIMINNFNNYSSNGASGRFRFYDENDNLIESGNLISQTDTRCETDNFIVTCSTTYNNSYDYYLPYDAIRTDKGIIDKDYSMYVSTKSQSPFFKVEFKNPVSIGRIEWVRRIDGLDNNVGTLSQTTSADFIINYIGDNSITKTYTLSGSDCEIVEQTFLPYKGNKVCYYLNEASAETDINIFSTSDQIIKIVDVDYVEDTDTFVRFAFTNDGSNYKVFKSSSWQAINISDVITNGNTADEIKALTTSEINALNVGKKFSILVKMKTNDEEKTPIIRKISVVHAK